RIEIKPSPLSGGSLATANLGDLGLAFPTFPISEPLLRLPGGPRSQLSSSTNSTQPPAPGRSRPGSLALGRAGQAESLAPSTFSALSPAIFPAAGPTIRYASGRRVALPARHLAPRDSQPPGRQ